MYSWVRLRARTGLKNSNSDRVRWRALMPACAYTRVINKVRVRERVRVWVRVGAQLS